jgi:two-component system cell cycle response regulator CtrA
MHILIVEDDPVVADVLGMTLEEAGHFQSTAHNIETALAELKHNNIDAVLLDINLPDGDGTRLARLIRKNHIPVPILVVSGNASTDDKIAALGAGADGYLTKPFDRFELLANLDAIIRRTHGHSSATVAVGNLEVDLNRHLALIDGEQLSLTGKEFRIVEFLALRKGSVLSKTAFLSHLYGGLDEPEPKIIDVFVCKLRRKLESAGARGVSIETVWGQGYILRETEAIGHMQGDLPDTIASLDADEVQANMPPRRRRQRSEHRYTAN